MCKAQATRRVGARAKHAEPCTHSCTMYILCETKQELTLVSSFRRLQTVPLLDCRFPSAKPPDGQMCVPPTPRTLCALPADVRFGGGLGLVSGLEMHRCTRLRLVGARSRPKCSTIRSETARNVQRDSKSSLLGLSGRPFWSKSARVLSLRKTYCLICFQHIEPPRDCPQSLR